jgi:hypothetical protein
MDRPDISEEKQAEYLACVVGAVTQVAAALETEISAVTIHGPGHHLGHNDQFLFPLAEMIDGQRTLSRYDIVLQLLRKPAFDKSAPPYQDASLVVKLRNELIHYKSKWGEELDQDKTISGLKSLRFDKPRFVHPSTNFFPLQCLNASLASWAVMTGVRFIDEFYRKLSISSPPNAHAPYLTVPRPRKLVRKRKT